MLGIWYIISVEYLWTIEFKLMTRFSCNSHVRHSFHGYLKSRGEKEGFLYLLLCDSLLFKTLTTHMFYLFSPMDYY